MRRNAGECLAANNAVEDEESLHRKDVQRRRKHRSVGTGIVLNGFWFLSRCETYPHEYLACTIDRIPSLGPNTALAKAVNLNVQES